ncbi:MAG: ADP-ribosyltransferase [Gordonia sp. (in: high G+C Gram-positive bacteria)]
MGELPAARRFVAAQRAVTALAVAKALDIWGDRPPADFDAWLAAHADLLVALVVDAQAQAVEQAADYVGVALDAQGGDVAPQAHVDAGQLVGVAGDGRPLRSLMQGAVITARAAIARTADPGDPRFWRHGWAESGAAALVTRVQTSIADAGRVATGLGIIARPDVAYTRVLVGSSCSRCAILAGRVYRSRDAFDRHPRCDCRHVPRHLADLADDAALDVHAFFESLSPAEQDRTFTVAGAQAIRDGADPAQVVNARRGAAGLQPAAGGQMVETTTEGMTKRGIAFKVISRGDPVREAQIKAGKRPRLMPETIYQIADSREEAIELLRRNGYMGLPPFTAAPISKAIPKPATPKSMKPTPTVAVAKPAATKPAVTKPAKKKPARKKPARKKPVAPVLAPLTFGSDQEARKWFARVWPPRSSYPPDVADEYEVYSTNIGYQTINGALRQVKGDISKLHDPSLVLQDWQGNPMGVTPAEMLERVGRMDAGMLQAPAVPDTIAVARGTRWHEFQQLGIASEHDDLSGLVGQEYIGYSYTSASVSVDAAMIDMPVQMKITVPPGARAVYMAGDEHYDGALSSLPMENEILLDRNTKFVVDEVKKLPPVVPGDPPSWQVWARVVV